MIKSLSTSLILRGLLALGIGVVALAWPSVTVVALVIVFAVYAFVAAGLQALHNEDEAFKEETEAARGAPRAQPGFDGYSFVIAFKGVLLEGLEVAFIVLTFGANQQRIGLASAVALAAIAVVIVAGAMARAPLARVPENTMKFAVGVMLSSFGMFWGAEGAGASWPGGDAALLVIVPGMALVSIATVRSLRAGFARTAQL